MFRNNEQNQFYKATYLSQISTTPASTRSALESSFINHFQNLSSFLKTYVEGVPQNLICLRCTYLNSKL